jgi:hypothetical protein
MSSEQRMAPATENGDPAGDFLAQGLATGSEAVRTEGLLLQAVMKEIADLESAMRELLQSADKGIAATGTLLVAGLSAFISQQLLIALIALPYALTATFFFMLQKYIDRQICAGRKHSLEVKVNRRLGQEIFQQATVRKDIARPDETAGYFIYCIGGVVAILASFWALHEYSPPKELTFLTTVWYGNIFGIAICLSVLAIAGRRMLTAEEAAYTSSIEKSLLV